MEKRTLLAMVLMLAVLLGWGTVGPKLFPSWFPAPVEQTGEPTPGDAPEAPEATRPPAGEPDRARAQATPAEPEAAPAGRPAPREEATVTLDNGLVRARLTSRGAALTSWELLGDRFEAPADPEDPESPEQPVQLVSVQKGQPAPFSTTFEGLDWPALTDYRLVASDGTSATFEAEAAGVVVRKHFRLTPERYHLDLDLEVDSPEPLTPTVLIPYLDVRPPPKSGFFASMGSLPDETSAACALDDDVERVRFDEDEENRLAQSGDVRWTGIDSRYFLTAVFQGRPAFTEGEDETPVSGNTCTLTSPAPNQYQAALTLDPVGRVDGAPGHRRLTGYLGPKFKTRLTAYGHDLDASINFGFLTLLSLGLLWVMVFFQGLVENWGVAIILLTVSVKALLLPLTNWSMRSMEKMRAIQPKLAALKARYGKDAQRYQQEMMKLYREEGVSPFGGCLPMLIQLPIWIALYRTILNTAELYHATFIAGWLDNLAAPEPGLIKVLPIAMGVSMFLMQRMQPTPQAADDAQAKMQKYMLYFMPPFFTFIMYSLPSGLTLYIFVNNILSIAQQYWIRKRQAALQPAG